MRTVLRSIVPKRLWAWLRTTHIRHTIRRFTPHDVVHRYGGSSLRIRLADPMAQGWYDRDEDELPEISLLRNGRLQTGARVFDLGAHQCVVALQLADIVGAAGLVVALEAGEHNVSVALTNRDLNQASRLVVLHAAIAESSGRIRFTQSLNGAVDDGSGDWETLWVEALSIDDLAKRYGPPDVLFIDIEGFELNALRGATQTMARLPDCFVEVHAGAGLERFGGSVDAVLSFFPARHYDLFVASEADRRFAPLAERGELVRERFFLVALAHSSAVTRMGDASA